MDTLTLKQCREMTVAELRKLPIIKKLSPGYKKYKKEKLCREIVKAQKRPELLKSENCEEYTIRELRQNSDFRRIIGHSKFQKKKEICQALFSPTYKRYPIKPIKYEELNVDNCQYLTKRELQEYPHFKKLHLSPRQTKKELCQALISPYKRQKGPKQISKRKGVKHKISQFEIYKFLSEDELETLINLFRDWLEIAHRYGLHPNDTLAAFLHSRLYGFINDEDAILSAFPDFPLSDKEIHVIDHLDTLLRTNVISVDDPIPIPSYIKSELNFT